jgi:hypothetical protein
MASRRFGFHSGTMTCQDAKVRGDITINDDIIFSDVSAGQLGVTGGIALGSSGSEVSYTAGTPLVTFYATNSGTSGATSAEPFYVYSALTGAGQVGGRCRFHCYSNVASGGWVNAAKAFMEFGASGSASGLASALCAETQLSAGTSSGTYCALEGELVLGTSASTGTSTSFIYLNVGGADASTFDTNGFLLEIGTGITPAAGKFASLTSQTIKCKVDGSTRYMVMSQMEDGLGLGTSGTNMDFSTTATTNAIAVHTTSASVTAGTSVRYIYGKHAATAAGGVGHRAEFHTTATAKLGGWANALKGYFEFGANGDITGLASGICAEVKMPNAAISGTMCVLELELVDQASSGYGSGGSFIRAEVSGTMTAFRDNGFLLDLQGLGSAAAGKLFDTCTAAAASHALRIRIGSTNYYIMLQDDVDA